MSHPNPIGGLEFYFFRFWRKKTKQKQTNKKESRGKRVDNTTTNDKQYAYNRSSVLRIIYTPSYLFIYYFFLKLQINLLS